MEATRGHLHGDLEVGLADVTAQHLPRKTAPHAAPPGWLINWEDRRPRLMAECFAEALGVFIYCFCGVGATTTLFVTTVEKVANFGNLLTIGLAYGIGIVLAIICCAPASGGHLSPCFTIAFWLFKGFPARKVPFYIVAQILGGYLGCLAAYGCFRQALFLITEEFSTVPALAATIYTPTGPAGAIALFTNPGALLRYVFLNEFLATLLLSIVVFSVLDPSNIFLTFSAAPFLIGIAYSVMIWGFAAEGLALNTARDLGGRFACASVGYGTKCFPAKYTAIATLTNILATQIGAAIQILLLSDSARPIVTMPPDADTAPSLRAISRGDGATSVRQMPSKEMEHNGYKHA